MNCFTILFIVTLWSCFISVKVASDSAFASSAEASLEQEVLTVPSVETSSYKTVSSISSYDLNTVLIDASNDSSVPSVEMPSEFLTVPLVESYVEEPADSPSSVKKSSEDQNVSQDDKSSRNGLFSWFKKIKILEKVCPACAKWIKKRDKSEDSAVEPVLHNISVDSVLDEPIESDPIIEIIDYKPNEIEYTLPEEEKSIFYLIMILLLLFLNKALSYLRGTTLQSTQSSDSNESPTDSQEKDEIIETNEDNHLVDEAVENSNSQEVQEEQAAVSGDGFTAGSMTFIDEVIGGEAAELKTVDGASWEGTASSDAHEMEVVQLPSESTDDKKERPNEDTTNHESVSKTQKKKNKKKH